jgi:hypothetical protein
MELQCPLGDLPVAFRNLQMVLDANRGDERSAINVLDVAFDFAPELLRMAWNSARFQRAAKRPSQSASDGSDEMIQRRRMFLLRLYAIEFLDPTMNPIHHRRLKALDIGSAHRPFVFINLHSRSVNPIAHVALLRLN